MASCNINDLLSEGKCFAAMPTFILNTMALDLWCDIGPDIHPAVPHGAIYNPEAGPLFNPEAGSDLVNPEAT